MKHRMNMLQIEALANSIASAGFAPADAPLQPGQIALANETRFNESYFSEPLTAYAVGWRDATPIEETLQFFAPAVPVNRRFSYAEDQNVEAFLSDTDDERAIGADFKRVEYTFKKTDAKTTNRGLTIRVDLDEVADKTSWQQNYVNKLMRRLKRSELRRAITLLSNAATNTAKTWDTTAGKDPDKDIETDILTATTASGVRPTRVGFGDTAWDKRKLAFRAQNNAAGYASAGMTPEALAGYLGVDRVLVSRERYQSTASAKAEIVNNLVLEFIAADNLDTEDSSNIKRFVSPVVGGGYVRVYEQQVTSKLYDITVEHYSLIKITSTLGLRKLTIS